MGESLQVGPGGIHEDVGLGCVWAAKRHSATCRGYVAAERLFFLSASARDHTSFTGSHRAQHINASSRERPGPVRTRTRTRERVGKHEVYRVCSRAALTHGTRVVLTQTRAFTLTHCQQAFPISPKQLQTRHAIVPSGLLFEDESPEHLRPPKGKTALRQGCPGTLTAAAVSLRAQTFDGCDGKARRLPH